MADKRSAGKPERHGNDRQGNKSGFIPLPNIPLTKEDSGRGNHPVRPHKNAEPQVFFFVFLVFSRGQFMAKKTMTCMIVVRIKADEDSGGGASVLASRS